MRLLSLSVRLALISTLFICCDVHCVCIYHMVGFVRSMTCRRWYIYYFSFYLSLMTKHLRVINEISGDEIQPGRLQKMAGLICLIWTDEWV